MADKPKSFDSNEHPWRFWNSEDVFNGTPCPLAYRLKCCLSYWLQEILLVPFDRFIALFSLAVKTMLSACHVCLRGKIIHNLYSSIGGDLAMGGCVSIELFSSFFRLGVNKLGQIQHRTT